MYQVLSVPKQNCRVCMWCGRWVCIEGRNDVVADEKFPQGPSFPALGHKQGPEGAWETPLALHLQSVLVCSCIVLTRSFWIVQCVHTMILVQLHCYFRFLLCILWPVNYTISDPWSSCIVHYGFLLHIIGHCLCTIFPFSAKEQPGRGSGRPNLNALCIVPFFRTAVCRKKMRNFVRKVFIVDRVSCLCVLCSSIDQHCTPADDDGWHNEGGKKVWLMLRQACNQTLARTMGQLKWRGQGVQYLKHFFFCARHRGHKGPRYLGALHHVVSSRSTKTGIWEAALTATCVSMRWGLYQGPSHS